MIILGLDTATPTASVALVEDGNLVAEELFHRNGRAAGRPSFPSKGNHCEVILPLIETILAQGRISLGALSGIGLSIGPGSFTGLRIALATVKGLAYEWGVPVAGVSTLLANAARVNDDEGVICSLIDARKHEVYAAIYHRRGQSLIPLSEERVCSVNVAIKAVHAAGALNPVFVGDGASAYAPLLANEFGAAARICAGDEFGSLAAQVARLSWGRFIDREADDLASLAPRYGRPSEAETKLAWRL